MYREMRGFTFALLGSAVVSYAACSVYDPTLYLDIGAHNGNGGSGNSGAGGSGETSGTDGGGVSGTNAYCLGGPRAIYPEPPTSSSPGTKDIKIVVAQYIIDLGDRQK